MKFVRNLILNYNFLIKKSNSTFRACVDTPLTIQCGDIFRNLMDHSLTFLIKKCDTDYKFLKDTNCQLPNELTLNSPTQRKLDDLDQTNQFDSSGGFYPVNPINQINPQLMNSYSVARKQSETSEDLIDSTNPATVNRESKSADKLDDEFQLNQANRFNRQDDEFETDKHRDYSTESPEYMMSHFSPGELHNHSYRLMFNSYLIHLIIFISLIRFL